MINKKTYPYAIAAFIPAVFFALLRLLYIISGTTCQTGFLAWHILPFLMVAGGCFYFFLTHSSFVSLNIWQILLLCTAYSFCSYSILQETSIPNLLLYAVFPVIFHHFENMILYGKYLSFTVLCAVMLLICPETGIQAALLLLVLGLLMLQVRKQLSFGNFTHLLLVFLFSFCLGAARVVFYLAPYIAEHSGYAYEGFSTSYAPAILISRFLPGGIASRFMAGTSNRMDLFIGMFPLLLFFLFFFTKEIKTSKKVMTAVFTGIILAMMEFSPVYYVFNLFHITYHTTLSIAFFLVFWMLYTGAQALSVNTPVHCNRLFPAVLIVCSMIAVSLIWAFRNFHAIAFLIITALMIIESLFLFLSRKKSSIYILLFAITAAELISQGYFSTSKNHLITTASPTTALIWDSFHTTKQQTKSTSKSTPETDYQTFIQKHQDEETENILKQLHSQTTLKESEKLKYCKTAFPDDFQTINGLCKKLGLKKTLFTPCDYTVHFTHSKKYTITPEGHHIYAASLNETSDMSTVYAHFNIYFQQKYNNRYVYQIDNLSGNLIKLDSKICKGTSLDYIPLTVAKDAVTNFQIQIYQMNVTAFQDLTNLLEKNTSSTEDNSASYFLYDYIGIGITLVSLFCLALLYLYDHKERLYRRMYAAKERLNHISFLHAISHFITSHAIYLLSFLIPFAVFAIVMIICDATPFGSYCILDGDGVMNSIPTFLDHYYKYQNGNHFLSMNLGYGSDLSQSYFVHLLSKLYHYLPLNALVPLMEWSLGIGLGLCGLNMTIYMTHRKRQIPANTRDFRLLLPACMYSMNAYILASRNYPTWYLPLLLFPLVMLSMDYLMEQKKWLPYTLLLGICILFEIQLTMFVCIYLVIHFFTYHFTNIRDLLQKGIRFALASLLGGGCGFLTVFRTLTIYQGSGYSELDNIFPSLGFHGSFWEEWRKLMLFTPTKSVSSNNGDISLYCGVFTLLLVLAYFLYKKCRLSDKLRYLLPIIFLCLSYNGQVLSYLWNGLHYQSSCPNRYAFLLIFLFAELAYEGTILLPSLSLRRMQILLLSCFVFFICCDAFTSAGKTYSILCTLTCLIIYYVIHCFYRKESAKHYYYAFVLYALLELSMNMVYTPNNWSTSSLKSFGDYQTAQSLFNKAPLKSTGEYYRTSFCGVRSFNQGQYNNTGCLNGFNTCLSESQLYLHQQYGFSTTTNSMYVDTIANPLNMSMASCKYIFLPVYSEHAILDLDQYNYIGMWPDSHFYVFENTNVCSLGYYYPKEVIDQKLMLSPISLYYLQLGNIYTKKTTPIYDYSVISYNTNPTAKNSYYFTDQSGQIISRKRAGYIMDHLDIAAVRSSQVKMHINYTAPKNARYYLASYNITPLGAMTKGKNHITLNLPNTDLLQNSYLNILIYNKENVQQMLDCIHENQLTDISIANDTITGTSNYEQDGYTVYSLAYSKNWHAYVDGKEVKTLDPYGTNLLIPTPAGKHTVTLKYVPQYLKECQIVTAVFWLITLLIFMMQRQFSRFIVKKRHQSTTDVEHPL